MNKRGFVVQYLWLFYLLLNIGILLMLLNYVGSEVDGGAFVKEYLSRDVALLVDTMYASPGMVIVEYDPGRVADFNFDEGRIKIKEQREFDVRSYPYVDDGTYPLLEYDFNTYSEELNYSKIIFIKSAQGLEIGI